MRQLKIIAIYPMLNQLELQDSRGVVWYWKASANKTVRNFKVGMKIQLEGIGY